jgi:flavin reductase (DIM6/NTAB) family NADH-FMN oxidoreductase RutF
VSDAPTARTIDPDEISGRDRYQLLTSLVVPRPIGWISTWGVNDEPNLAPFSYFNALASTPMLVGVSIGHRSSGPKDTLVNIRARRAFCVNIVTEPFLNAMNSTSADVAPGIDEFGLAGLEPVPCKRVSAPFVHGCPAVMECELQQEVSLGDAPNTLMIGRVVVLHLDPSLEAVAGTSAIDPEALRPVGRLWGASYATLGTVISVPRPE